MLSHDDAAVQPGARYGFGEAWLIECIASCDIAVLGFGELWLIACDMLWLMAEGFIASCFIASCVMALCGAGLWARTAAGKATKDAVRAARARRFISAPVGVSGEGAAHYAKIAPAVRVR